jgi:preprotein translocase subunit YajC
MYWFFVVVVAGVGFGWMMVRRRRKADEKTA